jgi:hypothetical protein
LIFIATGIILRKEFRGLLYSAFTTRPFDQKNGGRGPLNGKCLHLVHLLEQIVIDLLVHYRIELVSWMRLDKVPDPRRWCLEFAR